MQDIMHVDTDKVDTISKPEIDLNDKTVKLQSNFNTNEDSLVILHGPVNPMVSCRAQSVCLAILLLGRLSPINYLPVLCTFFTKK